MDQIAQDHKSVVAALGDDTRLKLTRKSDLAGLLKLSTHVVGLVLTGIWISNGYPLWQAGLVLHGIQLVFLFTLLHETVHDTPFASPWLNRWVGRVCGFLLFLEPTFFRYFHLAHHRHTHDPDKDPELEGGPPSSLASYFWRVSGVPIWWFHLSSLFKCVTNQLDLPYVPANARPRIVWEARVMLAFYVGLGGVAYVSSSTELLYLWLIPVLAGQPFLRLYLFAEHGRCPHVANMFENTRTTFTNAVVRWLAWNMPYHAEHHAYPAVPFHKLPAFHEVAKRHLKTTENGYIAYNKKQVAILAKGENA